jgi:spermidine synthase
MPGSFDQLSFEKPFVLEEDGLRSLHFTIGEVQSSMLLEQPDELQVDYTRTMMGFLLLNPAPRHIAMIGLGGGSLAKFCYRFLPHSRITVAENNPAVIALRRQFGIPDDDERLSVLAADGAAFIETVPASCDVLLVDGFDQNGQPPQLCSQVFYDHCYRALTPGGVLVANLHADDRDHGLFIRRILRSFAGNAMQVLAPEKCNCIVFAARERPITLQSLRDPAWTRALAPQIQQRLRAEFANIGWNARPAASRREAAAVTAPGSGRGGGSPRA